MRIIKRELGIAESFKKQRNNRNGVYYDYGVGSNINEHDIEEYKEMFNEIFEVIKKHNRKWKIDTTET